MTEFRDLEELTYFGEFTPNPLRAVGWLGTNLPFDTGEVSRSFFLKLCRLVQDAFEPTSCLGGQNCELCQFSGGPSIARVDDYEFNAFSVRNVWVPAGDRLLVAPEGILHYIDAHHYRPPDVFIDSVQACPDMGTPDYRRAFLAAGGRIVLATPKHGSA